MIARMRTPGERRLLSFVVARPLHGILQAEKPAKKRKAPEPESEEEDEDSEDDEPLAKRKKTVKREKKREQRTTSTPKQRRQPDRDARKVHRLPLFTGLKSETWPP